MATGGNQIDRTIALVGLMGAGKSTVGRLLARRLGLPFADSDEEVERSAGMSITRIFDEVGETGFRDIEREAIGRLLDRSPKVIATGGGAFTDQMTRARLLDTCFTVWLDGPVEILAQRAVRNGRRPLLRGREAADALESLSTERGPFYAQADLRLDCGNEPPERIADRIMAALAGLRR